MEIPPTRGVFHPPKQGRSQRTLNRIAEAALELMEEHGVEGATVADIVTRARASVGSFYARFPGKEDLIRYLRARVWTEARERWDQALQAESWEGLGMEAVVEGVVSLLLRSFRADYRQRTVLGGETPGDPEAMLHRRTFHRHVLETVTPVFLAHREEIRHPEPESAIRFGYHFVVGAIREFMEMEAEQERAGRVDGEAEHSASGAGGDVPSPGETVAMDELGPELARAWMGYLAPGVDRGGHGEDGAVDFFDPWG